MSYGSFSTALTLQRSLRPIVLCIIMQPSTLYLQQRSYIVGRRVLPFRDEHLCSGFIYKVDVLTGQVGVFGRSF